MLYKKKSLHDMQSGRPLSCRRCRGHAQQKPCEQFIWTVGLEQELEWIGDGRMAVGRRRPSPSTFETRRGVLQVLLYGVLLLREL